MPRSAVVLPQDAPFSRSGKNSKSRNCTSANATSPSCSSPEAIHAGDAIDAEEEGISAAPSSSSTSSSYDGSASMQLLLRQAHADHAASPELDHAAKSTPLDSLHAEGVAAVRVGGTFKARDSSGPDDRTSPRSAPVSTSSRRDEGSLVYNYAAGDVSSRDLVSSAARNEAAEGSRQSPQLPREGVDQDVPKMRSVLPPIAKRGPKQWVQALRFSGTRSKTSKVAPGEALDESSSALAAASAASTERIEEEGNAVPSHPVAVAATAVHAPARDAPVRGPSRAGRRWAALREQARSLPSGASLCSSSSMHLRCYASTHSRVGTPDAQGQIRSYKLMVPLLIEAAKQ